MLWSIRLPSSLSSPSHFICVCLFYDRIDVIQNMLYIYSCLHIDTCAICHLTNSTATTTTTTKNNTKEQRTTIKITWEIYEYHVIALNEKAELPSLCTSRKLHRMLRQVSTTRQRYMDMVYRDHRVDIKYWYRFTGFTFYLISFLIQFLML